MTAVTMTVAEARRPDVEVSRGRGLPRTAATIAITSWVVSLGAVVVLLFSGPTATGDLWFFAVDITVGCVYGTVSGVVLARRNHPVPWVLAVTAVGGALAGFSYAYTQFCVSQGIEPSAFLASLQGIAWVPGTLALFLVVPWLVRDHPLGLAWLGVGVGAAVTLAFTALRIVPEWDTEARFRSLCIATVVVGLVAAVDVTYRWRRGPEVERNGLGWLALGTTVMALSFLPLAFSTFDTLPYWFTPLLHLSAQAVFPAAVLVAVLRQRMWGLDLPVSRAIVAGLLTVGLALVYIGVAVLLARVLPGDGLAQLIAAAVVVVAVQPSRLWLQARVDRLVRGAAGTPHHAVRLVGASLAGSADSKEMLEDLVESVTSALRLESAAVLVDGQTLATCGDPTSTPVRVRLPIDDIDDAALAVTAPPGEALDGRSLRTLDELTSVVAAGVRLTRANADLVAARDRLQSVRLEERRILRREIHDGLGPSFAGLRLGLQGARNLIATDPAAAGRLIEALQSELDQRVDDVRALSRSLLPPALDELGLEPALDELVARHQQQLQVDLDVAGADDLPTPLAVAVYGIVSEALTNVARHSGADTCRVTVVGDHDELVVSVVDDGLGVSRSAVPGVGSRTMRERAEEQGGTLTVRTTPGGGTTVEARIPLERA